jgi:hypothetical protein
MQVDYKKQSKGETERENELTSSVRRHDNTIFEFHADN